MISPLKRHHTEQIIKASILGPADYVAEGSCGGASVSGGSVAAEESCEGGCVVVVVVVVVVEDDGCAEGCVCPPPGLLAVGRVPCVG